MSSAENKLIQEGLRGLDFYRGRIDGIVGPMTRAASERWLAAGGQRAQLAMGTPSSSLMIYQGSARHPVTEIVVHCAATLPDWMAGRPLAEKRAEIRRWHLARGWRDLGYHWLIDRDGAIMAGRAETEIGAGVVGHNQGVIHICLIGGHGSAATDYFEGHFTGAQDITLRQQIAGIAARTRIQRVSGHNEWAAKACPGFFVPDWLKEAA